MFIKTYKNSEQNKCTSRKLNITNQPKAKRNKQMRQRTAHAKRATFRPPLKTIQAMQHLK